MALTWDTTGLLPLPSGRLVRGRGLRHPVPDGAVPEFGVYLLGAAPPDLPWDTRWVRWPDFQLPADDADARDALHEAWRRAATSRQRYHRRAVETPWHRRYIARFDEI